MHVYKVTLGKQSITAPGIQSNVSDDAPPAQPTGEKSNVQDGKGRFIEYIFSIQFHPAKRTIIMLSDSVSFYSDFKILFDDKNDILDI